MDIGKLNFLNMWVETREGVVAPIDLTDGSAPPPETHPIACARFPLEVRTVYYRRRDSDGNYGGGDEIFAGTATTNCQDLLIAMAYRPWWRQLWRPKKVYSLHDAMIIVSEACERCLNALHHEYGVKGGYAEYSDEWLRCRTCCVMCRDICPIESCHCPHSLPPGLPTGVTLVSRLL